MVQKTVTQIRPGRRFQGQTMVNTDQNDLQLDSSTILPHNLGVMTYAEYYKAGLRRKSGYNSVSNFDRTFVELVFIDEEIRLRLEKADDDEEEKNAVAAVTDEVAPELAQPEIQDTELNDDVSVPIPAATNDNVPDPDPPAPTITTEIPASSENDVADSSAEETILDLTTKANAIQEYNFCPF